MLSSARALLFDCSQCSFRRSDRTTSRWHERLKKLRPKYSVFMQFLIAQTSNWHPIEHETSKNLTVGRLQPNTTHKLTIKSCDTQLLASTHELVSTQLAFFGLDNAQLSSSTTTSRYLNAQLSSSITLPMLSMF